MTPKDATVPPFWEWGHCLYYLCCLFYLCPLRCLFSPRVDSTAGPARNEGPRATEPARKVREDVSQKYPYGNTRSQ